MKPIINPLWVYFAEKSESVGAGFLIFGIIATFVFVFWYGGCIIDGYEPKEIKIPKFITIVAIVGLIIGSLLPSQKTILTMLTVSQITPNNIKIVGDTLEDTVDYITDKIEDIIDEGD